MSEAGFRVNKSKRADSVVSAKSAGGKALDKHCFAINIETDEVCKGKKHSGAGWSKHKKVSKHDKDYKGEICTSVACNHCMNY
jgi:hypothetical protein